MLEKLGNVPQQARVKGFRRWFADEEMELILWYAESGELTGFQLCYDVPRKERAFTWKKEQGLTHSRWIQVKIHLYTIAARSLIRIQGPLLSKS